MELEELIARLEAATGPDRELDISIFRHFNPIEPSRITYDVVLPPDFGKDDLSMQMDPAPFYTSSLDAALTLIPEGYDWDLKHTQDGDWAIVSLPTADDIDCVGETPAIALCIAALKARLHAP